MTAYSHIYIKGIKMRGRHHPEKVMISYMNKIITSFFIWGLYFPCLSP